MKSGRRGIALVLWPGNAGRSRSAGGQRVLEDVVEQLRLVGMQLHDACQGGEQVDEFAVPLCGARWVALMMSSSGLVLRPVGMALR